MDQVGQYNRNAWDHAHHTSLRQWTEPVSTDEVNEARDGIIKIKLTPHKHVPQAWFPELRGKKVLCLAAGGGQQGPLLAAAGAEVTVLDNSPRQLAQDAFVAQRDRLTINTELGDIRDLSRFSDQSFDVVLSLGAGHVEDLNTVWQQIGRITKKNGTLLSGFTNPFEYIFDLKAWDEDKLVVRHTIPYADIHDLTADERQELIVDKGEPFFFSNSLEDQIQGQIAAGFVIVGFYEDHGGGPLDPYINTCFATRAVKVSLP